MYQMKSQKPSYVSLWSILSQDSVEELIGTWNFLIRKKKSAALANTFNQKPVWKEVFWTSLVLTKFTDFPGIVLVYCGVREKGSWLYKPNTCYCDRVTGPNFQRPPLILQVPAKICAGNSLRCLMSNICSLKSWKTRLRPGPGLGPMVQNHC